jgi:hypothetical protein
MDAVPFSLYWAPGVGGSPGSPLLNAPGGAVNFALAEGASVTLFTANAAGLFAPGSFFTIIATFSDGSTAIAGTTAP